MTIQLLGKGTLALCLTPADLSEYGLSPTALTRDQALRLAKNAGVPLSTPVHIEVYPRPDSLLLFIRPCRRPRHYINRHLLI